MPQESAPDAAPVHVREVRLLEGPNLYFPRPTVKVSIDIPGYQSASQGQMQDLADRLGLRRVAPGKPHTEQRHRFLVRLVSTVVRRIAEASGTRLGVRGRPTSDLDSIVVAFPWRHRGRALAMGESLQPALTELLAGADPAGPLAEAASAVTGAEPGDRPTLVRPRIPVVSVTGTNGKTSTTRLLAHMSMTCGNRTGWSSTEGVFIQGDQVVAGDYSGPSGGRHVLADRSVQVGILETARGGLLLKGMGVAHNNVSVVTNVTADHLGTQGIDTVDQLAEVKSIITRVTRKDGWVVLNGDDPRVRSMAASASGRIWMFSLHPDSPALRETLDKCGRGITVLEDAIVILRRDADPDRLIRVLDVPMTLSGLSQHNIANALAATAAALALGLPREGVVEGLRTFTPDLQHNPGRMNVWTIPVPGGGSGTVIVDLAHNEAGLEALCDVAEGLRPPGARIHLGLGGVGDRTDEILGGLGEIAGRRADRVQITHKGHYLRGRSVEDLEEQFVRGLANVGAVASGSSPTEVEGLAAMVDSMTDGDVVCLMCHAERGAVVEWLEEHGATPDGGRQIRKKVIAARGEHELEAVLNAIGERPVQERVEAARTLLDQSPDDPRLIYELASALDHAGDESQAVTYYRRALAGGLREPHRFRAQVGLASTLRNLDQQPEAADLLDELAAIRPDSAVVVVLQALVDADQDNPRVGVARLVEYVMQHATGSDDSGYRRAMRNYAQELERFTAALRGEDAR
ncbi:tetratricopeptide repeat protein [Ornithinicoccus hortensis]|uniref:Cyanophycin synthetase n=1 Tax=Ornithinicoccus hortensis TaxID=82346 RepID=A0A542YSS8_9MICO|nr:tetratricopeptide repeat protein [Ornithinicoccus hortensis]TQL51128.1 cyanophycin synthetase [Ornithinicoccus hortensis]